MGKGKLVAVKIAPSNEGIAGDKLREEQHPNIITTHAYIPFSENEGCLVMEKVVGNAISALTDSDDDSEFRKQWCKAGEARKCVDIVKRVMTQILEGVQFIPRYVKPERIATYKGSIEVDLMKADMFSVGRVFGNLITLKNFTFNAAARGMELKFKLQNGNLNEEVWNNTFHCSENFCEGTWCDVHVQEVCKIVQGLQKVVPEERMTSATALNMLNPAKHLASSSPARKMLRTSNSASRLSPGRLA